MFPETKRALEVLGRLATALRKDYENGVAPEEGLPIFFMQTLYQAAMVIIEVGQGKPDKELQEKINAFRWLLQYFRSRWKVAGKSECANLSRKPGLTLQEIYLDILDAKEAFHDFDNLRSTT
jgi:hypothetical protein